MLNCGPSTEHSTIDLDFTAIVSMDALSRLLCDALINDADFAPERAAALTATLVKFGVDLEEIRQGISDAELKGFGLDAWKDRRKARSNAIPCVVCGGEGSAVRRTHAISCGSRNTHANSKSRQHT